MSFTDPGPIADVGSTMSADWANAIRDRLFHRFETTADRDAFLGTPTAGMIGITRDLDVTINNGADWLTRTCATRETWTPTVTLGSLALETDVVEIVQADYWLDFNACEARFAIDIDDRDALLNINVDFFVSLPVAASGHGNGTTVGTGCVVYSSYDAVSALIAELPYSTDNSGVHFRTTSGLLGGGFNPAAVERLRLFGEVTYIIAS